jgi:flagellar basal-body rod modification protein FlgD
MTSIGGAGSSNTPAAQGIHTTPTTQTGTVGNGELGKDAFLKLLVAQLKYQDPSKPADSSEFMAQTAQFTMVEKLEALADSQSALLNASQLQSATSLVGHTVSWNEDGVPKTGRVESITMTNGSARLQVGDTDLALADVTKVT